MICPKVTVVFFQYYYNTAKIVFEKQKATQSKACGLQESKRKGRIYSLNK